MPKPSILGKKQNFFLQNKRKQGKQGKTTRNDGQNKEFASYKVIWKIGSKFGGRCKTCFDSLLQDWKSRVPKKRRGEYWGDYQKKHFCWEIAGRSAILSLLFQKMRPPPTTAPSFSRHSSQHSPQRSPSHFCQKQDKIWAPTPNYFLPSPPPGSAHPLQPDLASFWATLTFVYYWGGGCELALCTQSPRAKSGEMFRRHGWRLLQTFVRKGRIRAIAVRRGSYKSLLLLNSGRFPYKNREIQFWTLVHVERSNRYGPSSFPSKFGIFYFIFWFSSFDCLEILIFFITTTKEQKYIFHTFHRARSKCLSLDSTRWGGLTSAPAEGQQQQQQQLKTTSDVTSKFSRRRRASVLRSGKEALDVASSEVIQEPLPLKPGILVKKSVVLVKRENGFTKTIPRTENLGKIRRGAF